MTTTTLFKLGECVVCHRAPVDISITPDGAILWRCSKCGDSSTFRVINIDDGDIKLKKSPPS